MVRTFQEMKDNRQELSFEQLHGFVKALELKDKDEKRKIEKLLKNNFFELKDSFYFTGISENLLIEEGLGTAIDGIYFFTIPRIITNDLINQYNLLYGENSNA